MWRSVVVVVLIAAHLLVQTPIAVVWAQGGPAGADTTPPSIRHDPPDAPLPPDKPFVVTAVVGDDVAVASVRLYFRAEGEDEYRGVDMTPAKGGTYTATIPARQRFARTVEYFIQADDTAGNVSLRGGAFSPLRLAAELSGMNPGAPVDRLTMRTSVASDTPWYKHWWVWALAGAVVVGAAAGGGGGGGGEETPTAPSGSATITAPIP